MWDSEIFNINTNIIVYFVYCLLGGGVALVVGFCLGYNRAIDVGKKEGWIIKGGFRDLDYGDEEMEARTRERLKMWDNIKWHKGATLRDQDAGASKPSKIEETEETRRGELTNGL
jgi:hypothetical protein